MAAPPVVGTVTHWGKAGQRITPAQARERAAARTRARRVEANRSQAAWDAALPEARHGWASGWVRPYLITRWLDYHNLYGPEVDRALNVPEPTVDRWEAGLQYPTWPELQRLANLIDLHPGWFIAETTEEPAVHICPPAPAPPPPRVTAYRRDALAAAGIIDWAPSTDPDTLF